MTESPELPVFAFFQTSILAKIRSGFALREGTLSGGNRGFGSVVVSNKATLNATEIGPFRK